MRHAALRVCLALLCLVVVRSASAQSSSPGATTSVPRIVRVTGVFVPANGMPPAPVETITLAIYGDESGGAPLWQETQ